MWRGVMTQWKLVPVDPTEEMVNAAEDYMEFIDTTGEVWDAMLTAAPRASEDEALVVRIANVIFEIMKTDLDDPTSTRRAARAVIKMLEGDDQ